MGDTSEADVDRIIARSNEGGKHGPLSLVGLYRLYLAAYGGDEVKARAGYLQYWQRGEQPAEVLAYFRKVTD